jgi:hypothetical protein
MSPHWRHQSLQKRPTQQAEMANTPGLPSGRVSNITDSSDGNILWFSSAISGECLFLVPYVVAAHDCLLALLNVM